MTAPEVETPAATQRHQVAAEPAAVLVVESLCSPGLDVGLAITVGWALRRSLGVSHG